MCADCVEYNVERGQEYENRHHSKENATWGQSGVRRSPRADASKVRLLRLL